jgi:hypothetical protein
MGRRHVRTARRALIGAGALTLLAGAPAGAAASPTIQVAPDRGLVDGQQVTVTGTGLEDICIRGQGCSPVGVLECVRDAPLTIENWDQHCVFLGNAQQTGDGYRAEVRVRTTFTPQRPGSSAVACGANGCDVVAGGVANGFQFLPAPITFSK